MKLLVIGGTRFLGPAIVDHALAEGHEVTLFNRGRSNPHLYPDLPHIKGDRNKDCERLRGLTFDAVIDTCGYLPKQLQISCDVLKDQVDHYLFISTVSVYAPGDAPSIGEEHPIRALPDSIRDRLDELTMQDVGYTTYGALKARSEQVTTQVMDGRATIVRPGLIVGPRDSTDRFHYWPWRLNRGGDVLGPGPRSARQQLIDVRDLGQFCVHLVTERTRKTLNAVGPGGPLTMGELVGACKAVTATPSEVVWADESFLTEEGLNDWEIPLWVSTKDPAYASYGAISFARAVKLGLTFRPLADTCEATLADLSERGMDEHWEFGDAILQKEAMLLASWRARR